MIKLGHLRTDTS